MGVTEAGQAGKHIVGAPGKGHCMQDRGSVTNDRACIRRHQAAQQPAWQQANYSQSAGSKKCWKFAARNLIQTCGIEAAGEAA